MSGEASGGAFAFEKVTVNFTLSDAASRISGCTAMKSGGGIFIANTAQVTIGGLASAKLTLDGNTALNYGGNIYVTTDSRLTTSIPVVLTNGVAISGGGNLAARDGPDSSGFVNIASDITFSRGQMTRAIGSIGCNVQIVSGNVNMTGGPIFENGCPPMELDTPAEGGGQLAVTGSSQVLLRNPKFRWTLGNMGPRVSTGGALYFVGTSDSNVVISGS
jgi:hypothetical protein